MTYVKTVPTVYGVKGVLLDDTKTVVWMCPHNHRTVGPAEDCARREQRRRR